MSEQLMSVTDVMKKLNISRMTVHRRVKEGKLKPVNASQALYRQHRLLFKPEDVDQLVNNSESDEEKPAVPAA